MAYDVDDAAVWCADEEPAHAPRFCRDRVHDLVAESSSFFVSTVDVVRLDGKEKSCKESSRRLNLSIKLINVSVCAIEGPDGLAFEQVREVDEKVHKAALLVVRTVGHLPGVRDMTNHMMGIAQVA